MSNLALGYRRIQKLLTWAIALSWVPLLVAAVLAVCVRQPWLVFVIGVVLILWLMRLGIMFDIFEDS